MGTMLKELIKIAREIHAMLADCRTLLMDIRNLKLEERENQEK